MTSSTSSEAASHAVPGRLRAASVALARWFDNAHGNAAADHDDDSVDWLRVLPFIGLHVAALFVFAVGFSWFAFGTALLLYAIRMFAITGFYHRYFSHKSFKTSRALQFLFALIGAASVQRGPLWWAAHHRGHHRHADTEHDVHSPVTRSFFWSHMGWFLTRSGFRTDASRIPDLMRFPELRWLDRFDVLVAIALAATLFALGGYLERAHPGLGTNAAQLLVWGFFVSTVVLFHATVSINSLAHRFGTRRYATGDHSRNNALLALITFGEGWHNNHHHFPASARQGFFWWEIDLTWYALKILGWLRLVWDLKTVPDDRRRAAA
jgi:stearoyl-CoA desaturase (delta-9 desaturase)